MNYPQSAVLENADLLRNIGEYFAGSQLTFILSFKAVRDALKPLDQVSGEKWIKSKKKCFVTSVSIIKWAQSIGCEFSLSNVYNSIFNDVASCGSVDVLRWLHLKYPPSQYPAGVSYNVCSRAAYNGHLPVLKYLQSLGSIVEWNKDVFDFAALGGHLHIVQWLKEVLNPPCPWGNFTCTGAAVYGHLHVLQWLRAQDPPCYWAEHTCFHAARGGYLAVLKWLRSQDPPCPWKRLTCINEARYKNYHEVVEWILTQPE